MHNPSSPPSFVSLGKKEKELLVFLLNNKGARFNTKAYSRQNNIPRSTVKDMADKLVRIGLAERPYLGNVIISQMGENILSMENGGVGSARRECREDGEKLSQHYTRYIGNIISCDLSEQRLKKLNPVKIKTIRLPNMQQHFLYFDDATIIISPKTLSIRIHDLLTDDLEENHYNTLTKALNYIEKLSKNGITIENIELDQAHYAKVNSYLADFLQKIDNRYFLDLGDGNKLWIDNSDDHKKPEDETNSMEARERIDDFLRDALNSKDLISDLGKMKEVVAGMIKLKLIESINLQKDENIDDILKARPTYIG